MLMLNNVAKVSNNGVSISSHNPREPQFRLHSAINTLFYTAGCVVGKERADILNIVISGTQLWFGTEGPHTCCSNLLFMWIS